MDENAVFNPERLTQLVELMKEHDLLELEVRDQEQHIRLRRSEGAAAFGAPVPGPYAAPMYPPAAPQAPAPAPAAAGGGSAAPAEDADGDNIVVIKSPMVGTFYSKPNPNSPSYVKVGDHIEPETTVCIIEAMKVFNEIPGEVRGKVVAVLVDNEEPVEFGKPLFKVDTQG